MRAVWVGKRQASRSAALIKAELRTGDDKPIGPCSIVDISKSGARARIDGNFDVPEMFGLFIPARNETRVCKLRWHRENEIGIEFIATEQITTYQAVVMLEIRIKAMEELLQAGGVPKADSIEVAPLEMAETENNRDLSQRLDSLEGDVSKTVELVQAQINDSLSQNYSIRLTKLETQSLEIHTMLKSLLPLLMNRAS